jgi:hypothetical protein
LSGIEFGKYEKFPFNEISDPQRSSSVFLHKLTNGKLNFGENTSFSSILGAGLGTMITGVLVFVFGLICVILCCFTLCAPIIHFCNNPKSLI